MLHGCTSEAPAAQLSELSRSILAELTRSVEDFYNFEAESDEDLPIKQWVVYSCVMICDIAESAVVLFEKQRIRAMAILSRSIYEFYITVAYFEQDRSLALGQLESQEGRRLLRASKGPFRNDDEFQSAKDRYKDWAERGKAGGIDVYSGNRNFKDMAIAVEGETQERCPTYWTRYALPSMYSHPDAAAIPDVLDPRGGSVFVDWTTRRIDPLLQLLLTNDLLLGTLRLIERLGVAISELEPLQARQSDLQRDILREKGFE